MLGKVTLGLKGHGRGKPGASTQPPRPTEADDAHNKEGSDIEAQQEDPVVARLTLSQMRVARIREERQKISAEKMAAAKQRREEAVLEAPCTSSVVIAAHAAAHAALASDTSIGGRRRPSRERPQVTLPHGQHFPHGSQAVAFLYGAEGTFRAPLGEVRYEWNVHLEHASARQPCNPAAIDAAVTLVHHTTRDRDGNLLLDPTRSGEMASGREGSGIEDGAFCEAAALGSVGQVVGRARLLFLFDDNLLGHAVAKVYGRRLPSGIAGASQAARIGTITRFQCLLAGVPSPAVGLRVPEAFLSQIESFWAASLRPSPIATAVLKGSPAWNSPAGRLLSARVTGHADAEARRSVVTALSERSRLLGSWHLLHESTADAISTFHTLRRLSEAKYDGTVAHFSYPKARGSCDVALMALFVAWLLAHLSARPEMEGGPALLQEVVDHHVALHAALLSRAASSPSASSLASSDTPGAAHARLAAGSGSSASEGSLGAGGAHDVASSNLQGAAGKTYLGWCAEPQGSEAGGAVATQPTCLATLALAAGTRYTFEPAAYPLRCENKRGTRTATNCSQKPGVHVPPPTARNHPRSAHRGLGAWSQGRAGTFLLARIWWTLSFARGHRTTRHSQRAPNLPCPRGRFARYRRGTWGRWMGHERRLSSAAGGAVSSSSPG